jgi:MoxR-like ATPase
LDRFIFNLWIDYPSEEEEKQIVKATTGSQDHNVQPVLDAAQIIKLQQLIRKVPVADHIVDYAVKLVRKTRPNNPNAPADISRLISWGAGPRASQCLILGAKARAVLDGRYAPSIDDVNAVAIPVLRHRMVTSFNAEAEGITVVDLIDKLLKEQS